MTVHCTGHAAFPVAAIEMLTFASLPAALRKSTAMAPQTWQDPCCEQIGVVELSVNDWAGSFTVPVNARLLPTSLPWAVLPHLHDVDLRRGEGPRAGRRGPHVLLLRAVAHATGR